jgi:hypothetical protein
MADENTTDATEDLSSSAKAVLYGTGCARTSILPLKNDETRQRFTRLGTPASASQRTLQRTPYPHTPTPSLSPTGNHIRC